MTVSIQRLRNGVLTSADQATLSILSSAGATILATTVIPPTSAGTYNYNGVLTPGSYTATWVFTTAGLPTETISRAFTVDSAIEVSEGVTLMDIERLIASRIGPYRKRRVGVGTNTVNSVYVPALKSTLDLGAYEGQYLLRRGLTSGDELITNFNSDDRTRIIATYNATMGTLAPDRAYTIAAIDGEAIEIHAVDPDEELRPAALDGLKRCFFWDTVSIAVIGSGVYNINLSASMPWLTNPAWVRGVSLSYPSQLLPPTRMNWWEPYRDGKDLKLYTKGGAVGSVDIRVLRPAYSLVNNQLSVSGPNDDFDVLYVDPDYAAWAGVLECWKRFPELLMPLAAQDMRPSRADAAAEFTKKGLAIANQEPDRRQVDYGVPDIVQIGNLAEPVS